jgi:hypothetical protein
VVTVTGVDDPTVDGDATTPITLSILEAAPDPTGASIPDEVVLISTLDDEVAGFTVKESKGKTEVNVGDVDGFTVVLDAQPLSDVVIAISSSRPDIVGVAPTTLTFTPENWSRRRTVFVTGLGSAEWDELGEVVVTISVDNPFSDDGFDDVPDHSISVRLR